MNLHIVTYAHIPNILIDIRLPFWFLADILILYNQKQTTPIHFFARKGFKNRMSEKQFVMYLI